MPLTSRIPQIIASLNNAPDTIAERTAQRVEQEARNRVPVDTGALRTSIEVFGAGGSGERIVQAGQGLDYGVWVEYGNSKTAAQPFMGPAAEVGRKEIQVIAKDVIKRSVG